MSSHSPRVRLQKWARKLGVSATGAWQTVYDMTNDQLLVSAPHYKLRNGTWSGGGPFYCTKTRIDLGPSAGHRIYYRSGTLVHGESFSVGPCPTMPSGWISIPTNGNMPGYPYVSWSDAQLDLAAQYATGYKRTRPGNPQASLGQFLVELRDLPKAGGKEIWKSVRKVHLRDLGRTLLATLNVFRSLGSEYLNYEFGWRPFVSDVRKAYYLWQNIDKEMARLIRENGRGIHRRATLESETTTTQTTYSSNIAYAYVGGPPPNWFLDGHSDLKYTIVKTTRCWYAAKYSYYIPDVSSSMWNARARLALFGALPTPELLWEVIPWSWLVDWFGNVGDIISNVSYNAVDNLTCKYSFVMKHTTHDQMAFCHSMHERQVKTPSNPREWDSLDNHFWSRLKVESKARLGGNNPFGLGVQLQSLTARQLAILAALGVSRGLVR